MGSEEHALPTVEPEETRLLWRLDAAIHRAMDRMADRLQIMWSRRRPPDRGPDPDYATGPDNLESLRRVIQEELAGREPDIHISNTPRPPKSESSWHKIVIGVAIIVAAQMAAQVFTTMTVVGSLTTKIDMYIESTNKRLDSDEQATRDIQRRLDRGAAAP